MKNSHRRLLILELIVCIVLLINSFIFNFLTGYKTIFFLVIILGLFKWLLGFEKDRHRYAKDFIIDEFIYLICFLLLYYLLGIIIGFVKTDFLNFNSFYKYVLPSILYIILREVIRYLAFAKSENNKTLTLTTVLILIFLDISSNIYLTNINNKYGAFIFIATIVIPAIFNNIIFSYMTKKIGFKPVLFYCLFAELYSFVLPIEPNASTYLNTIIMITLPTLLCFHVNNTFESMQKKNLDKEMVKRKRPILPMLSGVVVVGILVYFTSGYFNHWAIVIASNSMVNTINKGDVVVIDKVKSNYKSIKDGQILAYRYNGKIIVHRITRVIVIDNHYYFKTKGDANIDEDKVLISEDMVVGVVNIRIPYVGLPTVWLKNL